MNWQTLWSLLLFSPLLMQAIFKLTLDQIVRAILIPCSEDLSGHPRLNWQKHFNSSEAQPPDAINTQ
jgi:hypothetical protein